MHAIGTKDEVRKELSLGHDLAVTGAMHDSGRVDRFHSLIAPLVNSDQCILTPIGRASSAVLD